MGGLWLLLEGSIQDRKEYTNEGETLITPLFPLPHPSLLLLPSSLLSLIGPGCLTLLSSSPFSKQRPH